jgi:hypothetical protein
VHRVLGADDQHGEPENARGDEIENDCFDHTLRSDLSPLPFALCSREAPT